MSARAGAGFCPGLAGGCITSLQNMDVQVESHTFRAGIATAASTHAHSTTVHIAVIHSPHPQSPRQSPSTTWRRRFYLHYALPRVTPRGSDPAESATTIIPADHHQAHARPTRPMRTTIAPGDQSLQYTYSTGANPYRYGTSWPTMKFKAA